MAESNLHGTRPGLGAGEAEGFDVPAAKSGGDGPQSSVKGGSIAVDYARRFVRQPAPMVSLAFIIVLVVLSLIASRLGFADPNASSLSDAFDGMSAAHPLGTDQQGRDELARLVYGTRTTLAVSALAVALGMVLGVSLGLVSGFFGKSTDAVIQRITDVLLVFNPILLGLFLVGFLGPGGRNVAVAVGIGMIPVFARLARSIALSAREEVFVEASRSFGASATWILRRHLLPQVVGPSIALASLGMGISILSAAGLGFLGLGVPPPTPAWGTMMGEGRNYIFSHAMLVTLPGLLIIAVVIAFNIVGDGIEYALDPNSARGSTASLPGAIKNRAVARRMSGSQPHAVPLEENTRREESVLEVRSLEVLFQTGNESVFAVQGVDLTIRRGETLGIAGESGSGKTATMHGVLGLLPQPAGQVIGGSAHLGTVDLLSLNYDERRKLLGSEIGVVFQNPMNSFNPVKRIGWQVDEAIRNHHGKSDASARRRRILEALETVGLPDPARVYRQYPHELSGGMLQRTMIAMAMINEPKLIVADEPTTALDVTVQAQVLDALQAAQDITGAAVALITHDLGVLSERADRTVIMYAGKIVERGVSDEVMRHPKHPYTKALLASQPSSKEVRGRLAEIPGQPPRLSGPWVGCAFAPRCPARLSSGICEALVPDLLAIGTGAAVACHAINPLQNANSQVVAEANTRIRKREHDV